MAETPWGRFAALSRRARDRSQRGGTAPQGIFQGHDAARLAIHLAAGPTSSLGMAGGGVELGPRNRRC